MESSSDVEGWIYTSNESDAGELPAHDAPRPGIAWDAIPGTIAHDVGNALSTVASYTELLTKNSAAMEHAQEEVLALQRAGRRALQMVDELLHWSGKDISHQDDVEINELVSQVVTQLQPTMRGVDLSCHLSSTRAHVRANRLMLERSLTNLIMNGYEATLDGGKVVVVVQASRQEVEVCVTDTGCGIPPSVGERIFQPLFTTKKNGSGLGMANLKNFMHSLGGQLSIASFKGRGTRVALSFPLHGSSVYASPLIYPRDERRSLRKVLLCTGDKSLGDGLACFLRTTGMTVLPTVGAGEALLTVEKYEQPLDAIVCEELDGWMDSLELLLRIAEHRPKVRLFLSTSRPSIPERIVPLGFPLNAREVMEELLGLDDPARRVFSLGA